MNLSNYNRKIKGKIDIESMSNDYWGTLKQSQFYQPSGF